MSEVRLQVKNLCKNFGITKAVQNVSFNVNKGEVHALIGENGSGKSTLTNMLTGIYSIGSGQFILDGKEIHPKNQVEANNEGVSIIVQELGTLSGLTVAENIFLGHEDQFVHFGIKNTNAMNKKATELLKKYGFDRIKAADMIDHYNFEDRKLVEIVKATYFDPKIVVIDETTTALSQEGREELYKHMERIKKSGNTVIFISHDLPEILDKSDTITILRDGVYIDTVKSKDVTEDDLKKLMVGREVTGDYYRADYGEKVSDEVVLSVKNVTVPGLIEDVTFDLHKGEILGFGGLSESGMHEIGKAIFGASYDRTGSVTLADGTQIRKGAFDAIRKMVEGAGNEFPKEVEEIISSISSNGGTPLVVCVNKKVTGVIELQDIIKPGIQERFERLRKMGVKTVMVTGDNPLTAKYIAEKAGVDDFIAEAKPEDKMEYIKKEQQAGKLVAMMGDGTNDAPALAQANVGVAMNSGTQAAKEAGNMVDLDNDPTKLIEIVEIGKQLLMTRGTLTTFSIANDVAKYFAIVPALFMIAIPELAALNIMHLHSPESAILSAVIFNAIIIPILIPLALRGVQYKPIGASALLRRNLLIYGLGGVIVPFVGIKLIDLLVGLFF